MINENCEDCLVYILRLTEGEGSCTLSELSSRMGRPENRISGNLRALENQDYVKLSDDGCRAEFTPAGLELARQIRKKHHIMEKFLTEVLGVDDETAHSEACRMEHRLSDESMKRLCHVVGENGDRDCGSCSDNCCGVRLTVPLDEMDAGQSGKILHVKGRTPDDVRKLISMGFIPGRELKYEGRVSENGPRIVTLGDATIALDAVLSSAIFIDTGSQ